MSSPQNSPNIPEDVPAHEPRPGSAGGPGELWRGAEPSERELQRMHSGVPIQCQFCVGQTFRRSRLRASDFGTLLLMRYPVRCIRCAQRQAVSFTVAGISMPSHIRRRDSPGPQPRDGSRR